MAYIPLIKTTKWIDLSDEHKKLREEIERDTRNACSNHGQVQPIMLQGAFGIGKTNSLYYLFHYGWNVLKAPTFYVSLDELTKKIKEYATTQLYGKMQNSDLGSFINDILIEQIERLKNEKWEDIKQLYFPEFSKISLTDYVQGFQSVEIVGDINAVDYTGFSTPLSESIIRAAIESGNRPLLLIDEFESKFYELKKYVETSGGGVLRELFDQIVQDTNMFYLVIGNGPASGYEVAKERGEDATDSETAANRRLKTKQIPFPTVNLLKKSFLKGERKGFINYIWWLSRCRPGHIQKLKDTFGSFNSLLGLNMSELITKPIFKEPIDEGGEAVTYLKIKFFDDFPGRIQQGFLNKLLINFEPQLFDINEDDKKSLRGCSELLYCSANPVETEKELLPVLKNDFFDGCLKKYQEEENKYDAINYIEHIQPFLHFILNAISDEDGKIAFGMINDSKPDNVLAKTFLIPLLELVYDFVSLFQDDSIKETKQTLDFLLNIIKKINDANEREELETFMPNTCDLFDKCKLLRNNQVYLQLSLLSIRESIEQPIGSPVLKYKNEQISECINDITSKNPPLIYQNKNNLHLYFIPDLDNDLLKNYLGKLKDFLFNIFYDKIHKDGKSIIRIVYFNENELIEKFKNKLINTSDNTPEPAYTFKKVDVINFAIFQLNFESQIKDYIDSVLKIGIIGVERGELNAEEREKTNIIELKSIVKIIGERPWTEKKETIRTIEHYRKLFFDGDNSVLNLIYHIAKTEYKAELAKQICNETEYWRNINDYSYLDTICNDESEDYDEYSTSIALLYLIENKVINEPMRKLLDLIVKEYKLVYDKETLSKNVNFETVLKILTKDKDNLKKHSDEFDLDSKFLTSLSAFAENLLNESDLKKIDDFYNFLNTDFDSHWIRTYHEELGGFKVQNLIKTIYALIYIKTIDYDNLKSTVSNDITKIEQSLDSTRTGIVSKLEELRIILNENDALSSYPEKLSKIKTSLNYIKSLVDNTQSYSIFLVVYSIIEHIEGIIYNSKTYLSQISDIYKTLENQKNKINDIQEDIDDIYSDSLAEKLIDFDFEKKQNNGYLWKSLFLGANLKRSDEYEKLWENKTFYNPFSRSTIIDDKITKFSNYLNNAYNRLSPVFIDLLKKLSEKRNLAKQSQELNNYISELLKINDND